MSKKYLNKKEKKKVLILSAFSDFSHKYADELEEIGRPSDLLGDLRRAGTYAKKVIDKMFEELDQSQVNSVVQELDNMEVVAKYSDKAIREKKKLRKMEKTVTLLKEDLYDLLQDGFDKCQECDKHKTEAGQCRKKELLIRYDVPKPNADNEVCPYQYK